MPCAVRSVLGLAAAELWGEGLLIQVLIGYEIKRCENCGHKNNYIIDY